LKIESGKFKVKKQNNNSLKGVSKTSEMWFCCSAVRIGRGFKSSLSERGRYTGTGVRNG